MIWHLRSKRCLGRLQFQIKRSPRLRFLDREGVTSALTTDVSLARRAGPALGSATGVAVAGAALWRPPDLLQRLRRYVDDGGRLASFGADAFRRGVHLGRDAIGPAARPAPANVFGERTALLHTGEAPLSVFQDDLGLFDGLTGLIGDFTLFERSARLSSGTDLVVAAGREPGQPAFVAYRLGRGLVLRSGTPQWTRELDEGRLSVEVPTVTKRIWRLLSGR